MSSAYRVPNDALLQEVIDDEVIMIDLTNYKYYSMNKSASFIWLLLQQGCGMPDIVKLVARQCNLASSSVKEQVKHFIDQLLAERLIVENGVASIKAPVLPAGIISPMSDFIAPLLSIFMDASLAGPGGRSQQ